MTIPKEYLKNIYRTPLDRVNRIEYLRLDKNENLIPFPEEFIESIKKQITPDFVGTYPQISLLYDKLSKATGFSDEYLFISAGSEGVIKTIFEAYVEPGDRVIIPDPTYAMYEVFGNLFRADLVKVPYDSKLDLNLKAITRRFTKRTKLVVLANPNSPTGTVIEPKILESFIATAQKRDILVLIDEAYVPYYPKSAISLVRKYNNLIVTRSFSKASGLASLRIGYAIGQPEILQWLKVFRPMYETNGFSVLFAGAVLDNQKLIDSNVRMTIAGREYLDNEIKKIGLKTFKSYTNFLNIVVGKDNVTPLVNLFMKNSMIIKPGSDHPALRDCIRITSGSVDQMKPVVVLIQQYFQKRKGRQSYQ